MQTIISKKPAVTSLLLMLSLTCFSFSTKPGGDSFEIYLNKKLVMQHYVSFTKGVQQLVIGQGNFNDQVDIYYSHCGTTGKDRTVYVKDAHNKVVKTWQFADATGNNKAMTCKVKDILALQKTAGNEDLRLFYSSHELPEGRLLASIVKENVVRKI